MLRLDVRRTKLAGFIACEEDDSPGFFCVPLEHVTLTRMPSNHLVWRHHFLFLVRSPGLPGRNQPRAGLALLPPPSPELCAGVRPSENRTELTCLQVTGQTFNPIVGRTFSNSFFGFDP